MMLHGDHGSAWWRRTDACAHAGDMSSRASQWPCPQPPDKVAAGEKYNATGTEDGHGHWCAPWCPDGASGSRSCIPWHSDDESLFGPPNQPKLIVSMSLGHSVEFQVRRASSDVPSSITLDHGELLVMDGLAQSEYAHRTVSGLQGLRVNLTYRWVTQHAASCPLAGLVGCVLPACVRGLAEPGSRRLGEGENKWILSWDSVLLL